MMHISEDTIQQCIVQGLTAYGYTVLVTSRRLKRCRNCGAWPGGADGATRGIPDLLVTRKGWGPRWIGLEVKGPTTRVRPEQKALMESGMIVIVRSWEEAYDAVTTFKERMEWQNVEF